jgi:hypothetical protein
MLESKAPVITLGWKFAQKTFTTRSDNKHHQFCKQMPGRFSQFCEHSVNKNPLFEPLKGEFGFLFINKRRSKIRKSTSFVSK